MATSCSSEDSYETAASAIITMKDTDGTLRLRDLQLNEYWKIGDSMPRDNEEHAAIYQVLDTGTGLPAENLEAHVFALDHSHPKVRKHRLRSIKRMKQRTRLELRSNDTIIIVISTLQATDNGAPEKNGPKHNEKVGRKTPYQRESARTRQRERRRTKRSCKGGQEVPKTNDGEQESTQTTEHTNLDDEGTDFSAGLILLTILYDATGTMRREISQEHSAFIKSRGGQSLDNSMKKFLEQATVKLESPADMDAYLKVKRVEMISMRRQLARVPNAETYHRDKLGRLVQEQAQHQQQSDKWREIEDGPKDIAESQLQTVLHAKTVLPRILNSQKNHIRSIERKRARAVKNLASMELSERRDKLTQKLAQYETWTSTIFPLSCARQDLMEWWEEVQSELEALVDDTSKEGLM